MQSTPPTNLARARRFFLAEGLERGEPRLCAEDEAHAARVLRLGAGDELLGMDGRGALQPLRVVEREKTRLRLEAAGAAWREPAPGEPGAPLPWIEVAFAPPRGGRAEELVDRLVQLGAAALTPLVAERTQHGERAWADARLARIERTAREACKQARRAWLPVLHAPLPARELARQRPQAALGLLDPEGDARLVDWALALDPGLGTRERPIVIAVGPEGGFASDELAALSSAGARPLCLGPHVLRIETACEAALAGLVQVLFRPGARARSSQPPA